MMARYKIKRLPLKEIGAVILKWFTQFTLANNQYITRVNIKFSGQQDEIGLPQAYNWQKNLIVT